VFRLDTGWDTIYIISLIANKTNYIAFEQALRRSALRLFSPLELRRILGVSAVAAQFLVHRYARRGALVKLRNGLYALADRLPSELAMANRLYQPSYISFEYALAYYHLIPETVYTITSATSRPTRTLTAVGKTFEYHRLKRSAFTGYEPTKIAGETVLIATPEKAVADYLYFVDLRKQPLNDRLHVRALLRDRLVVCARLFDRPSLMTLLNRLWRVG
jgi:predicted transcriptional regulator of viral defense system